VAWSQAFDVVDTVVKRDGCSTVEVLDALEEVVAAQ
jgi:hypothetical protein